MRKKEWAFYLFAALFIFGGQFLAHRDLVTGTPPPIVQTTLAGETALHPLGTRPALIYFWAEWCGVCRSMQNSVTQVGKDHPLATVALRSGDDAKLQSYLRDKNLNWPVVNDNGGEIGQRYGVKAVPALFFTDRNGSIVFATAGYTSEWGIRARLWLAGWF